MGAIEQTGARLAHVDAAALPHDLPQLDQLRGVGPRARVVTRARRESDRALLEALADQPPGLVQLLAPERGIPEAEDLEAHRRMRYQVGRVDRDSPVIVAPERGDAAHVEVVGRVPEQAAQPVAVQPVVGRRQGRVRHAVDAEELRRDALPKAVRVLRIGQQRPFGVGVGVDEARRDDQAGCLDHAPGRCVGEVLDRVNRLSDDADVGAIARAPRAIDDGSASHDQVEHARPSRPRGVPCNRPHRDSDGQARRDPRPAASSRRRGGSCRAPTWRARRWKPAGPLTPVEPP